MTSRTLRVSFAPAARSELVDRASYYTAEAGQTVTDRFIEAAAQTLDILTRMPRIGRVFQPAARDGRPEIRRIALSAPFDRVILFYSCTQSDLRVERLLHSAQDVHTLFD